MLTELCLRSKALWGYDNEFMQACRGELTLTASTMRSSSSWFQVAEIDGHVIGVAQVTVKGELAKLDKVFVEPTRLRSGAGKALFEWAANVARRAGTLTMVVEADPNAAGFYRRMGAIDDGTEPSGSIGGRLLPKLQLRL
jgi:N-acetylglutamate synthase-like GNAT family acetyltransferase